MSPATAPVKSQSRTQRLLTTAQYLLYQGMQMNECKNKQICACTCMPASVWLLLVVVRCNTWVLELLQGEGGAVYCALSGQPLGTKLKIEKSKFLRNKASVNKLVCSHRHLGKCFFWHNSVDERSSVCMYLFVHACVCVHVHVHVFSCFCCFSHWESSVRGVCAMFFLFCALLVHQKCKYSTCTLLYAVMCPHLYK